MRRFHPNRARPLRPPSLTIGAPLLAALVAVACVPDSRPLWPALTGESAAVQDVAAPTATVWPAALVLNDSGFEPAPTVLGPSSGTEAGDSLRSIEADLAAVDRSTSDNNRRLQQMRGQAVERADAYVAIVSRIDARLRAAVGPGDPALLRYWRQALAALDRLAGVEPALARLAERVAADRERTAEIAAMLEAATDLPGATEADRQMLARLTAAAAATVDTNAAMLDELRQDLATQRTYVAAERPNLQILRLAIANGEAYGVSLANRAVADPGARTDLPLPPSPGDSPLVVIRFEGSDIRYAQPLYRAASLALERRPDVLFTLVAVAPVGELGEARARSDEVRRTLAEMGLPDRHLTAAVWSDPDVEGHEVHLYVR